MSRRLLGAAFALAAASTAIAHDADTIAFYPFKEGDVGTSAFGVSITNDVDAALYAGTVQTNCSATVEGTVTFSDDVPGKYVFAGKDGSLICSDPQSLHYTGDLNLKGNAPTAGGNVSFADLGTALSKVDAWTVEFFWKSTPDEMTGMLNNSNIRSVKWNAGIVCTNATYPAGAPAPIGLNLPESVNSMRLWAGDDGQNVNWYTTSSLYNYNDTNWLGDNTKTLLDGLWHHIAITYDKSTGTTRTRADYCVPDHLQRQGKKLVLRSEELTTSEPFDFGCFRHRGHLACLRVTKRVLATSEYMYVSNDPNFYPDRGDTVLHWRLEGENGVSLSDGVASISNCVKSYRDINTNIFYGTATAIVPASRNGWGVAHADANAAPMWTNAVPHVRKTLVTDGEGKDAPAFGETTGSIRLEPAAVYDKDSWMKSTPGIYAPYNTYSVITGGSFTCECFMRFDRKGWLAKNIVSYYPRAGIMGMPNESYNLDWKFFFDFATTGLPDETTSLRPQLQVYVRKEGAAGGREVKSAGTTISAGTSFADDKWHHCAVVYDDEAMRFTAYIDYSELMHLDLPTNFVLIARENSRNLRFGYGVNDQTFMGEFDEIRLSRVALQPSQFLHLRHPPHGGIIIIR